MRRFGLLILLLAALGSGCAGQGAPPDTPSTTGGSTTAAGSDVVGPPDGGVPTRLASHLIMEVGDRRRVDGLGSLLEMLDLVGSSPVRIDGPELVAESGGVSCLRFRYREVERENGIQTQCVVVVEDSGSCEGLAPVELDLEQFLVPDGRPVGNADLLESGEGLLYRLCTTGDGLLRLEAQDRPLPPLYFVVVDALTDGPYALGDEEVEAQRAGVVTAVDGTELAPPWLVTVSREITTLEVGEDGSVSFNDNDCAAAPSCTYRSDLVAEGDILRISFGIDPSAFADVLAAMPVPTKDRFFAARIGMSWSDLAGLSPDARVAAFARLVSLDVMGQLLEDFDRIHDLRARSIRIGYWPYWLSTYPVTQACLPDDDGCAGVEATIAKVERDAIGRWKEAGFRLWWAGLVSYLEDGAYAPLSDRRPEVPLFEGVVATLVVNDAFPIEDIPAVLRGVVAQLAEELGPDRPVILAVAGPPITFTTQGVFCEADICPSDFEAAFLQGEAILDQALTSLSPDQFQGFGVALFDGSHFDIRRPYEDYGDFWLNRVGETGYNNPLLNIWRTSRRP